LTPALNSTSLKIENATVDSLNLIKLVVDRDKLNSTVNDPLLLLANFTETISKNDIRLQVSADDLNAMKYNIDNSLKGRFNSGESNM
jgi:hypothetical protein